MKAILVIVDIIIDTLKALMKLGTDVMILKLGELEVRTRPAQRKLISYSTDSKRFFLKEVLSVRKLPKPLLL